MPSSSETAAKVPSSKRRIKRRISIVSIFAFYIRDADAKQSCLRSDFQEFLSILRVALINKSKKSEHRGRKPLRVYRERPIIFLSKNFIIIKIFYEEGI